MLRGLSYGAAALLLMVSTGCSDPAAPPPVGGAYVEISSPSPAVPTKQCPNTGGGALVLGKIPPSGSDKGSPLTHDEGGATVECSVDSGKFSGFINKSPIAFRMKGEIDQATGTGTGSLAVYDPGSLTQLVTDSAAPCTITVTEPQKIGGETAWASFSCPALTSPSQPNVLCAAPVGYFYFDKCN